jgi:hypothetical protein
MTSKMWSGAVDILVCREASRYYTLRASLGRDSTYDTTNACLMPPELALIEPAFGNNYTCRDFVMLPLSGAECWDLGRGRTTLDDRSTTDTACSEK